MKREITPLDQMGSKEDFQQQKHEVLQTLEGEKLLETTFEKKMSSDELDRITKQNTERGAKELFNPQGIALKTELTELETVRLSQLMFLSQRYNITEVDDFVSNLLQFKVSLQRKGRREFIQGLHAEERREMGADLSPFQALMNKIGM